MLVDQRGQSVYLSHCPLPNCHWASDPLHSEEQAREARRGHLSGHPHGDLVDYVASTVPALVDRYEKQT